MPFLVRLCATVLLTVGLAACFGNQKGLQSSSASSESFACLVDAPILHPGGFNFIDTDTGVFRQGARIKVIPRRNLQPAGIHDLPAACLRNWAVRGPVRFDAATRTVTINEDAPIGSPVTVTVNAGAEVLRTKWVVIGRSTVVLTGTRSQQGVEGCQGAERVGELEFGASGRFSVTFRPFESYRDYWGTYTFDPVTNALEMTAEGGNFLPSSLDLEGAARVDEAGRLVIEGIFLGNREGIPPIGSCRYFF
jgi:hypothetical protein